MRQGEGEPLSVPASWPMLTLDIAEADPATQHVATGVVGALHALMLEHSDPADWVPPLLDEYWRASASLPPPSSLLSCATAPSPHPRALTGGSEVRCALAAKPRHLLCAQESALRRVQGAPAAAVNPLGRRPPHAPTSPSRPAPLNGARGAARAPPARRPRSYSRWPRLCMHMCVRAGGGAAGGRGRSAGGCFLHSPT